MINFLFLIILVIIILLVILIASITLIPFHITLNLNNKGLDYNGYFKITWLRIGILKREIPIKEEEKEEKKEVEKKAKAEWTVNRIIKIFNLFLESMPYFENIFYAVFRSITIEKLRLNLALGMDSPVDTAQMAGFFWSILPTVNLIPKVSIHMNPVFMKSTFEGNLEFELKIRLFWIVIEGIKAITKKPIRSLINEVRA
ncbi:MAG: DUF2953 domain-containing protein [Methanobacterium sp.]|uniref:DUF2953 domain-containing protein n=1 Tax=Methanobacterium sp. TaxID=2164 RepID=UPI003C7895A1